MWCRWKCRCSFPAARRTSDRRARGQSGRGSARTSSGGVPRHGPVAATRRILINLKPADLIKEGSHFDLPLALGVLAAMDIVPVDLLAEYAALGELSLDGSLNKVAACCPPRSPRRHVISG